MKNPFKSKTVWSAILKAVAGIITSVVLVLNGENTLSAVLPGIITTVWGVVDVIIRYNTGEIVGFKK